MNWSFTAAEAATSNPQSACLTSLIAPGAPAKSLICLPESLPPQTLTNFALFPRLPPEIRIMIWKLIKPEARSIKLVFIRNPDNKHREQGEKPQSPILRVKNPDPALLFVNRESRHECLRNNAWVFCSISTYIKPFYINPAIDTLQIDTREFMELKWSRDLWCNDFLFHAVDTAPFNPVTRVTYIIGWEYKYGPRHLERLFKRFPKLEYLKLWRRGGMELSTGYIRKWRKGYEMYCQKRGGDEGIPVVEYCNAKGEIHVFSRS
jgi:hypothetical protein